MHKFSYEQVGGGVRQDHGYGVIYGAAAGKAAVSRQGFLDH